MGLATSDRIRMGTVLSNMTALTGICLIYPTTFTSERRIFTKGENDVTEGWLFYLSGTSGALSWVWCRGGASPSNDDYVTSAPLLKLNTWQWVVAAALGSGTPTARIYVGDYAAGGRPLQECTYSTATDGSGSYDNDSPELISIGCDGDAQTRSFQGSIALVALFKNAQLDFDEIRTFTKNPRAFLGDQRLGGLWRPGWRHNGGTSVVDESGNGLHSTTFVGGAPSGVRPA
jgi:hypothetical protein